MCVLYQAEISDLALNPSPGLEHATIKDNILFGCSAPFDEQRYHDVVYACALEQDLSILDAGDMTGETSFLPNKRTQ
jgi:hypothetical protein